MIRKSTYIREFTPRQTKQLKQISEEEKINTTANVLLYTLEVYQDQKQEIERLKRFLVLKQNKIETLKAQIDASI